MVEVCCNVMYHAISWESAPVNPSFIGVPDFFFFASTFLVSTGFLRCHWGNITYLFSLEFAPHFWVSALFTCLNSTSINLCIFTLLGSFFCSTVGCCICNSGGLSAKCEMEAWRLQLVSIIFLHAHRYWAKVRESHLSFCRAVVPVLLLTHPPQDSVRTKFVTSSHILRYMYLYCPFPILFRPVAVCSVAGRLPRLKL
uniref:Uncharacterized protein TCIL3000_8_4190 n=1 Tax=Trypanosoma congolense (strain IL3000) TaxID=1068625 RepID=G0US36_TRYCI|nr:unnamed protein product [Trypanosoma congolense IL3000]